MPRGAGAAEAVVRARAFVAKAPGWASIAAAAAAGARAETVAADATGVDHAHVAAPAAIVAVGGLIHTGPVAADAGVAGGPVGNGGAVSALRGAGERVGVAETGVAAGHATSAAIGSTVELVAKVAAADAAVAEALPGSAIAGGRQTAPATRLAYIARRTASVPSAAGRASAGAGDARHSDRTGRLGAAAMQRIVIHVEALRPEALADTAITQEAAGSRVQGRTGSDGAGVADPGGANRADPARSSRGTSGATSRGATSG